MAPGSWSAPQGRCLLSDSKHAVASTQAPPALGRARFGPGTETGKLMHGLVSQRAVPSPHTEYLGITYFEGSNADRSSALGLRLNQQNKMKKNKTYPVISTMPHVPFAKCSDRPEIVTSDFI